VIEVRSLRPVLEGLVLRSTAPSIVVDVVADSPAAAAARAEQVVSRALAELGQEPTVRAQIISTAGERVPCPAARLTRGEAFDRQPLGLSANAAATRCRPSPVAELAHLRC
jgi:hypothetical protein